MSRPSMWNVGRGNSAHAMLAFLLAGVFCSLIASTAVADAIEWTDPTNGDFDDAGNWTVTAGVGSPPPAAGDTVNFNEIRTYTVTLTQNEASDFLFVTSGNVTLLSDSATVRQFDPNNISILLGGTLNIGSATNPVFLNGDFMSMGSGGGD